MICADLTIETFLKLRDLFYDKDGQPIKFELREKGNTQDDPFDEYISMKLNEKLNNIICKKSPGALISPDMVVYRNDVYNNVNDDLRERLDLIFGIEVKKVERNGDKVSRPSGIDYNSTPPCGTIRIYTKEGEKLDIAGFYLFICLEQDSDNFYFVSALTLCDGNIINADFNYYLSIVGPRTKEIGVGTYGEGLNRVRPMIVFPNPLGAAEFDRNCTLITRKDFEDSNSNISKTYEINRTTINSENVKFYAYKYKSDKKSDNKVMELLNPFPVPKKRVTGTQSRGKFKLD